MMRRMFFALVVAVLVLGPTLLAAAPAEAASFTGFVNTDVVNVRAGPSTSADIIGQLTQGEAVNIVATVSGDFAAGTSTWYQLSSGGYVISAYIGESLQGSEGSSVNASTSFGGHWIDVNLSNQTATAYIGSEPVHTAYVTTGKAGHETPTGTFTIFSRVANETMSSSVPGDSYYQPNVLFTQYFAGGGYALHYNYWQPDSVFGSTPTSHGCVGMRYGDAAYFWDFATYGTPVVIHY